MIYVGIDVSKDKHDCYIVNSDGEIIRDVFTIANTTEGFGRLYAAIRAAAPDLRNVKVGLEATGHYSYNTLLSGHCFHPPCRCFFILLQLGGLHNYWDSLGEFGS